MRRREGKIRMVDAEHTGDGIGQILGVDDFLEKAERLIAESPMPAESLRAQIAAMLSRDVAKLRLHLARGADPDAIFYALWAAFHFRTLLDEIADDARPDQRRKITRNAYLKAKQKRGTQEGIAEELRVSVQALRKWRRENIED